METTPKIYKRILKLGRRDLPRLGKIFRPPKENPGRPPPEPHRRRSRSPESHRAAPPPPPPSDFLTPRRLPGAKIRGDHVSDLRSTKKRSLDPKKCKISKQPPKIKMQISHSPEHKSRSRCLLHAPKVEGFVSSTRMRQNRAREGSP